MLKKMIVPALLLPCILLLFLFGTAASSSIRETDKIFLDGNQNIYFVVKSEDNIEIHKISTGGKSFNTVRVKRFSGYDYTDLLSAAFGSDDKVYFSFAQTSSLDYQIKRLSWMEADFKSGRITTVYEEEYTANNSPGLAAMTFLDDMLKIAVVYTDKAEISCIDIKTGDKNGEELVNLEQGDILNNAAFYQNADLLLTDIYCGVYTVADSGVKKLTGGGADFCQLTAGSDGEIYFYFTNESVWKRVEPAADIVKFTATDIEARSLRYGGVADESSYVQPDENGDAVLFSDGTSRLVYSPQPSLIADIFLALAVWAIAVAVYTLILFIIAKFKIPVSLLFKQSVIIIAVMGVGVYALTQVMDEMLIDNYRQSIILTMRKTVHKMANGIDIGQFLEIDWQSPQESDYFSEIRHEFLFRTDQSNLLNLSGDVKSETILENYYVNIMFLQDGRLYAAVFDNEYIATPMELTTDKQNAVMYERVLAEKEYDGIIFGFEKGSDWAAMLVPLLNEEGEAVAYIECGISMRQFNWEVEQTVVRVAIYISLMIGLAVLALTAFLWISMRTLKKLKRAVDKVGAGEYDLELKVRGNDEISKIAASFNEMSQRINGHTKGLEELNAAYYRFLPLEVMHKLDKDSVLRLNSGDNALINAVVLYISISGFSAIAASQTPDDAFTIFNDISAIIMETALAYGGLTESCNQSGFICLFEKQSNAYDAALMIRKKLGLMTESPLSYTLSLIKGEILIGIAGDENRLCTFAVSKSIKLAQTLADEAREWGIGMVCGDGFEELPFKRYMGRIVFESAKEGIFDCFEGDEIEIMQNKEKHCELFEKGVALFERSKWQEAKSVFIEYLKLSAPDLSARRYLFHCERSLTGRTET